MKIAEYINQIKKADAITTPDLTSTSVETPAAPTFENITVDPTMGSTPTEAIPQDQKKPSFISQQVNNYVDQQVNKAIDLGKNTAKDNLYQLAHDVAGTYLNTQEAQDALNKTNIPGIYAAIKEDALPALNSTVTSPLFDPLKAGLLHYGLYSSPEERETLLYSLMRIAQGQVIDPMWPHASPFSFSAIPHYNTTSFLGQNTNNSYVNDAYQNIRWGAKRIAHPPTLIWDTPKAYRTLQNWGAVPDSPVLDLLDTLGVQNETPEQYIRQGALTLNAARQAGETAQNWMSDIPGMDPASLVSDSLNYLSTGIPHGVAGNAWNAAPIALYAAPRYGAHVGTSILAKDLPLAVSNVYSILPTSSNITRNLLMNKAVTSGIPVALKGINYATDAYLADEVLRAIETQTNINGNSNYDAKKNLYTAPFDIWQKGKTKPGKGSVVIGTDTFGNQEFGTHSYDPNSIFNLGGPWSNNSEYKKQRKYLDQMEKDDPTNEKGIPYGAFYNRAFLPVYTEKGDYVLAIPPRERTWGEYAEDWGKWWNGEPITSRPDQRWTVPVDANGSPVPARMPENEDDILHPLYSLLGMSSDRKADARDYGAQIRRIHGMLSRRPRFSQLNKAWDDLIKRNKQLTQQRTNILSDLFATGGDLAEKVNMPLIDKLAKIGQEFTRLEEDVNGLYMLENYYQYKANEQKYERGLFQLPWEKYVESKSEEERKRLPKNMVADWQSRTIPARKEKILKKAVEDAVSGWFVSKDPQSVTDTVRNRLLELRRHIPIPFTEEDIYKLSAKDIQPLIPTEKPQPTGITGILGNLLANYAIQQATGEKPKLFSPIITAPFFTDD